MLHGGASTILFFDFASLKLRPLKHVYQVLATASPTWESVAGTGLTVALTYLSGTLSALQ